MFVSFMDTVVSPVDVPMYQTPSFNAFTRRVSQTTHRFFFLLTMVNALNKVFTLFLCNACVDRCSEIVLNFVSV